LHAHIIRVRCVDIDERDSRNKENKMIARAKEHLVGLAVLLIVAIGSIEDAKSGYVPNVTPTQEGDGQYRVEESTYEEVGNGVAYASEEDNYVFCAAEAWTWATGDTAYLEREGYGDLKYAWTWQGGGTPTGGTLSWEIDGDGDSAVDGDNLDGTYADAFSYGVAASDVWGYIDVLYMMSSAGGLAYGYVYDDAMASGDAYGDGAHTVYTQEEPDEGLYHFAVQWNSLDGDDDTIPSGTGYFYFQAGAQCACTSQAEASSGSIAHTDTSADATVDITVSFDG
jgi:hypothetical protein